jgi:hypothetical protein
VPPPKEESDVKNLYDLEAQNFVFLIDLSNEMNTGGVSFKKTIETIKNALKFIPVGSKFNICTFG